MPLDQLMILAIIQGITEFLPISSSAHLIIFPVLMGWKDHVLFMDVAVHLGTLCSVLVYFHKDVRDMLIGFFHFTKGEISYERKLFLSLVVATCPVVLVGYVVDQYFSHLFRSIHVIAFASIFFGLLLYLADKIGSSQRHSLGRISTGHAFIWGMAQVIAFIHGVSRSGICMTAGRFLGYNRVEAAHFSFLMAIPTIIAAGTLKTYQCLQVADWLMLKQGLLGALVSFLSGLLAISFMMKWLKKASFLPFVIYRIILGIILLRWFTT